MAPPTEPSLPPTNDNDLRSGATLTGLTVQGTLPASLSGRLVAIGPDSGGDVDGVLHSVHLHQGRALSYRSRRVITGSITSNIIAFGGSILALGDGSLAYELTADLTTLRRVDLAGQSSGMSAYPKRDPRTGDLHILAVADNKAQAHVVVSSGALTRMSRPILAAPSRVKDLAVTRDRVVFVADGFAGVTARDGEASTTWITTGVDAPHLVHAHDVGDTIVIHAVTPSLERWTLHSTSATMRREVIDPTPRRFARTSDRAIDAEPQFLWTAGHETADKYDLATTSYVRHFFGSGRAPGDLVFVVDTSRPSADGGWLVGFVHHGAGDETDLVVLDAADMDHPAIATVRIPRRVVDGHHSTWIPLDPPLIHTEGARP
ncbi:MAG: carotenoid oxygenase family protein [Ilumatobacteraceae bacterium]